jgi:hypothetical protein
MKLRVERFERMKRVKRAKRDINQTIFAVHAISIYVTFYKAEISSAYWEDFEEGLPEKSEDYN